MMRAAGLAWLARLLLAAAAESQVYLSPDGGYRGVSVHIDGGLKQENCNQIITDIKVGSNFLYLQSWKKLGTMFSGATFIFKN